LKFQQIIFRKFLLLFVVLFIAVGGLVYFSVKELYIDETKVALQHNIEILALSINKKTDFDALASNVKKKLGTRLTIISKDGEIICESHEDKRTMDNHRYRQEVIQADKKEFGFKIRTSSTIKKNLLYVVKKYTIDGKTIYIRMAKELKSITSQIVTLGFEIISIVAVFFISIFIIAYKINIQIQDETKRILNFLKALTKKKKENYINSDFSEEFHLITQLLTKVSKILIKQDKQKHKYTSKLQASNTQKDDIISAISHEFKNPIAVINGYAQTLLEDVNINQNIQHKFLNKIYKNGNRLNELIDTLRLSTKLDNSQQKLTLKKLNLYKLIEDSIETLKHTYKSKEIEIQGLKELEITVDEALFGVVFTNLIENAFKYSEDEVIVKISQGQIDVIDSGIGIKEKDIEKLSDKFYRVSGNTWNNSLGLGLFLVNNIVELHHFKLQITSKENEGSTFSVIF